MGTSHQPVARPVIDGGPVEIARAFFSLPESAAYAVGGGMAAIAYGVIARPTEDIDLFRDRRRAGVGPQEAADAFADAARGRGWLVRWARRFPEYARIEIAMDRDGGLGRADLAERIRRVTEVLGPAHFPEMLRGRFDEMQTFFQAWRSELLRAGR